MKRFDTVRRRKPATAFDQGSREWKLYFSALTDVALDFAGETCVIAALRLAEAMER